MREKSGRHRGRWRLLDLGCAAGLLLVAVRAAGAATPCALPAAFGVQVEQHGATEAGGPGLVAVAELAGAAGMRAGDTIRQANGMRVDRCGDLERAAAEALAKGLALLLGVERDGVLSAVALVARPGAVAAAGRPSAEVAALARPAASTEAATVTAPPALPDGSSVVAWPPAPDAAPAPARSPVPHREAVLPPLAEASGGLRQTAARAAATLTSVDDAAGFSVPLVLYERRLHDAEATIAALSFATEPGSAAVQAVVGEVLDYHRTARDIRHAKLDLLSRRGMDRRTSSANAMPYFSDSQVPQWIASYPFLQASLLEAPRETRFIMPGEVAGRWDPDRALDLLWARARAGTTRLAEWAHGG
jgi:hypothetical protein